MKNCSSCGTPFECQSSTKAELCSACLLKLDDYYMDEAGLLVFTEAYHLKRGTCCNNSCRHCPFDKTN